MEYWQALVLGIVEGASEYLPISSTFHLIWTASFLGIGQSEFQKLFEVVIQSGAILSVLVLYFKLLRDDFDLVKKVVISFLPTAVVGLVLYKIIKDVFFTSPYLQLAVFILVGVVFLVFERTTIKDNLVRTIKGLSYKEAAFVGLIQALAVIPGVSRAGAVILILMLLKVKRDEAAKYSFLLAVPTLFAASALDLIKARDLVFTQSSNLPLLLVGFGTSFIVALAVMRWFVKYLQSHDLTVFGWYRIGLGVILLAFLLIK